MKRTKSPNDLSGRARWNGPWTLYWRRRADSSGTLDNQKLHDLSAAPFQLQRQPVRTHAHAHIHSHTHTYIYHDKEYIYIYMMCVVSVFPSTLTRRQRIVEENCPFQRVFLHVFISATFVYLLPSTYTSSLTASSYHPLSASRLCHTRATRRLRFFQLLCPLSPTIIPLNRFRRTHRTAKWWAINCTRSATVGRITTNPLP